MGAPPPFWQFSARSSMPNLRPAKWMHRKTMFHEDYTTPAQIFVIFGAFVDFSKKTNARREFFEDFSRDFAIFRAAYPPRACGVIRFWMFVSSTPKACS